MCNYKLLIASENLHNTLDKDLSRSLISYINEINNPSKVKSNDFVDIDKRMDYINEQSFDISGWGLWEIPIEYCYIFHHKLNNLWFDLNRLEDEVIPCYLSGFSETEAESINEAISKYKI